MNKAQAYQAMCQGHKVYNEYYSPEEYAFINDDGLIEYEDGCVIGDQFSSNWVKYQDPECKLEWNIYESTTDLLLNQTKLVNDPYDPKTIYQDSPAYHYVERSPIFISKHSHKRSNKRK